MATLTLAPPPAGHHQRLAAATEDAAAMAQDHLPAASRPLPCAESEAGAGVGGKGKKIVRDHQRPSYMGDGTTTNQEHLATKASSLFNRKDQALVPGASNVTNDELPELLNPNEPWLKHHCVVDRHDFNTGGHVYNHMLYKVNVCLIQFSKRRSSEHWVLCPEPSDPNDAPCGYVIVPLRGLDGYQCALAFRADNLDLAAFANGRNKRHVFERYAHLMPTATVLDFDNNYSDFIGEGDGAKMSVTLSGASLLQATSMISLYMKAPGINERYIKQALGTIAIGIPEAKRFTPVRQLILSGWLQGTTLNEALAEYLSRWREVSCALMAAEKSGDWGTDEDSKTLVDLGIAKSKQKALDIVDVLHDCPYQ